MLAKVMLKEVERLVKEKMLDAPAVILVDHGSPSRQVTKLRDDVAAAMRDVAVQSGLATSVTPASMERGMCLSCASCVPFWQPGQTHAQWLHTDTRNLTNFSCSDMQVKGKDLLLQILSWQLACLE